MSLSGLGLVTVALYDASYRPRGQVPDYVSVSVSWEWLAAGSGTLVVGEADPAAQILLSGDVAPVLVVVTVAGLRWSGRVASAALDFDGPDGTGTITATLVDDWVWLRYMLASQSGSAAVTQTMPQFDTQTGPAATVAAYYINAAARRLGAPVLAVPPLDDTSQAVTLNARMAPLADLLTDPLKAAGVSAQATIWLPGDDQPIGVHLRAPTVIVTLAMPPPKPWLRWSRARGGIVKGTLTVNAGTAYRVVLGLDTPTSDDPATRNYDQVIDGPTQAGQGTYGLPEVYADVTDATFGDQSQARGAQELADHKPTVSAAVEVIDGDPWTLGEHYFPGDVASLEVAGVVFTERMTRATVADDRENGLTVTPVVGDSSVAATSDELLIRAMSSIAVQLRTLQARR